MLMDVIFYETRVRTCRHRIYKRNLVSVKKKLNLKQRIMATVLVLVREVTTETASMATNKKVPFTNNILHTLNKPKKTT